MSALTFVAQGKPEAQEPQREVSQVVDMVVARVDKRIVTLSELLAETRLVLLRQSGPAQARAASIDRELLSAVLRNILARNLLLSEARRLNLRPLPPEPVQEALRSIRRLFQSRDEYVRFLERFGFELGPEALSSAAAPVPPLLVAIIRAELEVERFISLRINSSLVVSDEEIRNCYEQQSKFLGGQTFEQAKPRLFEAIRRVRGEQRLIRMVNQLSDKADLSFTDNFKLEGPLLDPKNASEDFGLQCLTTE